jgi:hypothetical protein
MTRRPFLPATEIPDPRDITARRLRILAWLRQRQAPPDGSTSPDAAMRFAVEGLRRWIEGKTLTISPSSPVALLGPSGDEGVYYWRLESALNGFGFDPTSLGSAITRYSEAGLPPINSTEIQAINSIYYSELSRLLPNRRFVAKHFPGGNDFLEVTEGHQIHYGSEYPIARWINGFRRYSGAWGMMLSHASYDLSSFPNIDQVPPPPIPPFYTELMRQALNLPADASPRQIFSQVPASINPFVSHYLRDERGLGYTGMITSDWYNMGSVAMFLQGVERGLERLAQPSLEAQSTELARFLLSESGFASAEREGFIRFLNARTGHNLPLASPNENDVALAIRAYTRLGSFYDSSIALEDLVVRMRSEVHDVLTPTGHRFLEMMRRQFQDNMTRPNSHDAAFLCAVMTGVQFVRPVYHGIMNRHFWEAFKNNAPEEYGAFEERLNQLILDGYNQLKKPEDPVKELADIAKLPLEARIELLASRAASRAEAHGPGRVGAEEYQRQLREGLAGARDPDLYRVFNVDNQMAMNDLWNRTGVMTMVLRTEYVNSQLPPNRRFPLPTFETGEELGWLQNIMRNQEFRRIYDGINWEDVHRRMNWNSILPPGSVPQADPRGGATAPPEVPTATAPPPQQPPPSQASPMLSPPP